MPFQPDSTTPSEPGRGRSVLVLVTGGIAAYKACTVVRRLADAGCSVRVAMTDAATHFVTPMTFEALTGQSVGTTLWGEGGEEPLDHINWVRDADLVVVSPCTANFLAKLALGLADDLPSTLVSAAGSTPVVVAPAMNDQMWRNPPNQQHLATLRERGVRIVEPGTGFLACGVIAEGRLAEPEEIVTAALAELTPGPLRGHSVLVTAGGTREPIDAVRYIGNRSSGRMGIALAARARDLGAATTLLLGPTDVAPPAGVEVHRFGSVAELQAQVERLAPGADAVVMTAAVSDYRPVAPAGGKRKKADGVPSLTLEATPDLLAGLGQAKPAGQCLIGFALETGDDATVQTEAQGKLERKSLDVIVGNRADVAGEGFESTTNRVYVLDRDGRGEWLPPGDKAALAIAIWDRVLALFAQPPHRASGSA